MGKYVGQEVRRVEDPRFIMGKGRYVTNLNIRGMAYAAILRSPHAHAKIQGIDVADAKQLKGVVSVFTGQDLVDAEVGTLPCGFVPPDIKMPAYPALATDKVRYVGQPVVVVIAESRYIAQDALDHVYVDYEVLDAVVNAKEATADGAPQLHDDVSNNTSFFWALGDKDATDKAIADADKVIELDLINQRLIPNAMEPRAVVAQWDDFSDEMTVWTTSQNPHVIRILMSAYTLFIRKTSYGSFLLMWEEGLAAKYFIIRRKSSSPGLLERSTDPSNGSPYVVNLLFRMPMAGTMSPTPNWLSRAMGPLAD